MHIVEVLVMKLKIIGIVLSIAGFLIGMASNAVSEKQQDATIEQKINEALKKRES